MLGTDIHESVIGRMVSSLRDEGFSSHQSNARNAIKQHSLLTGASSAQQEELLDAALAALKSDKVV